MNASERLIRRATAFVVAPSTQPPWGKALTPPVMGTGMAGFGMARACFAVAALMGLVGCGGGDDDAELPSHNVQPVNCQTQPLRCI